MSRRFVLAATLALAHCAHYSELPAEGTVPPVTLGSPPPGAKNLNESERLAFRPIASQLPHLSVTAMINNKGRGEQDWVAKVCVDNTGAVAYLQVGRSFQGADPGVADVVWKWRFPPQPQPVCTLVRLIYNVH